MFGKKSKPTNRIDTLIGHESTITGDIAFSGGLRVDGVIKGNVTESATQNSTLVLSEQGKIEGSVIATHLVINGKIIGPVRANQYVELQPKSHIVGDVHYQSLEMHTGAIVEGKLIYIGDASQSAVDNT